MVSYDLDNKARTLTITADEFFAAQEFTPEITEHIYKKVKGELPKVYRDYDLTIITNGMTIDELIPNRLSRNADKSRLWGNIDYNGQPWVKNISSPVKYTHGLQNRHIALWASHGRYFDNKEGRWRFQRPKLFCTTEDLFTQTIVIPYLIPMLEKAGAVVFTPRERDWQKEEVIVDNDAPKQNYIESNGSNKWQTTSQQGFAWHAGSYHAQENPFEAGTARMAKTTGNVSHETLAIYQPYFSKAGRYAVYVSYQTLDNSVDDALYTVWHKGEKTQFHVNQQMGGSTWVYLGTFDFDEGYSIYNRVTITNHSRKHGVVTTDAVRFGGGMGNIERNGTVSGLPRALEGARYSAQWAGMPYAVYSTKDGQNDYADDINVRSLTTNLLGGGSCYMPTIEGRKVPFELSLAVHSDAGYARDGKGLIGALSVCTTNFHDGKLNAGISRMASRDLADALLSNEVLDIKYKYGQWNRREIFDRNYSETRLPEVPSAILETMQDVAGAHSLLLGCGREDLVKQNIVWVLSRSELHMDRYPAAGEKITVHPELELAGHRLAVCREGSARAEFPSEVPAVSLAPRTSEVWLVGEREKVRREADGIAGTMRRISAFTAEMECPSGDRSVGRTN